MSALELDEKLFAQALADVSPIDTWEELDRRLGRMRELDTNVRAKSARYDRVIQRAEARKAEAVAEEKARYDAIEQLVLAYVKDHAAELVVKKGKGGKAAKPGRSRKLVHGTVGMRLGKQQVVLKAAKETVLAALRVRGHIDCIVETADLVMDRLRELPAPERALVHVAVEQSDSPFLKLHEPAVVDYPTPPTQD